MHIDFLLPQTWIEPNNNEHILLVAKRVQLIRYGEHDKSSHPVIQEDKSVNFPLTNDYWLFPPTSNTGQPKGHWRLVARYDSEEEIGLIVKVLKLWLC